MIVLFLEGKMRDYEGRLLKEIWAYDDKNIERIHNFIQWIFPLDEPSRAVPSAPVLFEEEIDEIKKSYLAKDNLIKSKNWFIEFLKRTDAWVNEKNHNHLRISRMIKSLRILHSDEAANSCFNEILNIATSRNFQSYNVIRYWQKC